MNTLPEFRILRCATLRLSNVTGHGLQATSTIRRARNTACSHGAMLEAEANSVAHLQIRGTQAVLLISAGAEVKNGNVELDRTIAGGLGSRTQIVLIADMVIQFVEHADPVEQLDRHEQGATAEIFDVDYCASRQVGASAVGRRFDEADDP